MQSTLEQEAHPVCRPYLSHRGVMYSLEENIHPLTVGRT